ncbi:hypothetical protein RN001_014381 [Aquatica leii]|uniref:MIT domain-containing protein n=1 Tax=Aquatica leii TaxID=1421715 RepID=A0AAN7NXS1_9COLE|nr:hypothetical protein RN001_014381 [Aquatica leii]
MQIINQPQPELDSQTSFVILISLAIFPAETTDTRNTNPPVLDNVDFAHPRPNQGDLKITQNKALKIDEENEGQKELVIELYRKGINELELGIAVQCWGSRGEVWERAQRLHEKMKTNLAMAKDRLQFLESMDSLERMGVQNDTKALEKPHFSYCSNIPIVKPSLSSTATVKKLTVATRRPAGSNVSKSQSLPRSMGSRNAPVQPVTPFNKQDSIPPAIKKQLSVSGNNSPGRKASSSKPTSRGKSPTLRGVDRKLAQSILDEIVEGESEKLVRALFAMARKLQPSIIFIDEVDSLLSERSNNEHEASRRLKTEFFVEFDGLPSNPENERVIVMAAKNRPQELDEAALRRFPKRVYVTLPDADTRCKLLSKLLSKQGCTLSPKEPKRLATLTEGYSGSDLTALAKDAALGPIKELDPEQVKQMDTGSV